MDGDFFKKYFCSTDIIDFLPKFEILGVGCLVQKYFCSTDIIDFLPKFEILGVRCLVLG